MTAFPDNEPHPSGEGTPLPESSRFEPKAERDVADRPATETEAWRYRLSGYRAPTEPVRQDSSTSRSTETLVGSAFRQVSPGLLLEAGDQVLDAKGRFVDCPLSSVGREVQPGEIVRRLVRQERSGGY